MAGNHDGEHAIPGQIASENGSPITREQTPGSTYIGSAVPQMVARNVVQLHEEIPSIRVHRTDVLAGNASMDLSERTRRHVIA